MIRVTIFIAVVWLAGCVSTAELNSGGIGNDPSADKRLFNPTVDGNWIGNGISYSPYRDGQGPDTGANTSKQDILQDLRLLAKRWQLIRLYGAGRQSEMILEVIAENQLPIRVMQGVWLSSHQSEQENLEQLDSAMKLANRFPAIVVAINVGNEIFVDWSWHRVDDMDWVIDQIRRLRAAVDQPVTVSDDYNFWNKPEALRLAAELDFICLHAYAFWNSKKLDEALSWSVSIYRDIEARYPEQLIAFCENGWPTSRIYADGSYEGGLVGIAGEAEQANFFQRYDSWIRENKINSFYFSSFDEQWKGGFDGENAMQKAEKHWGLYNSDRTAKPALR